MAERYPLKAGRYSSHSKILKIITDGKSRSLLDVGCAQGHLMTAARDAGWTTTGIEYDEKDAEIARQFDLKVHLGSAEIKLDELGVAKNVATLLPNPVTPVLTETDGVAKLNVPVPSVCNT
jgi:predicted RNA methylase